MKKSSTSPRHARLLNFVVVWFSLLLFHPLSLNAQMVSVVNSLADDGDAHPWDDPLTPVNEEEDGFCQDALGRCTFRAALEEADIVGMGAYVSFSVSGTLELDESQFSFFIPDNSIIDGGGRITINGGGAIEVLGIGDGNTIKGLTMYNGIIGIGVAGTGNIIGGGQLPDDLNIIYGMAQSGISLYGDNNTVKGNVIGLNQQGDVSGSLFGIYVAGRNNTIGGTLPEDRNVISGNVYGIGAYPIEGNLFITGNYIGTDQTGTEARPNNVGINIVGPHATIGGITEQERNIISGNAESGILLGVEAFDNAIIGNTIGLDVTGTMGLPNRTGVVLGPGSFNTIVNKNMISANNQAGIQISGLTGVASVDHKVYGNEILLNGGTGIVIEGLSINNTVGSSLTNEYEPNIIQFNGNGGVAIVTTPSGIPTQNTVRKNSFQDNAITAIYVDVDNGAQNGILPPLMQTYLDLGLGVATIAGTHQIPGSVIDIYIAVPGPDDSYQGITWLGSTTVDIDNTFSLTIDTCTCDYIAATATDPLGNTSEFSNGLETEVTAVMEADLMHSVSVSPNPFHQITTISFSLREAQSVELKVYDFSGREVSTLTEGRLTAGEYHYDWHTDLDTGGMFFYQLKGDRNGFVTGKMVRQ